MNIDTEKIRKYFLGDLSEMETEDLEQRIIAEPDLEAEFVSVENDLVEDFIHGNLSGNDRQLFLRNYLVTDERKNNIETVSMLLRYSQERSVKEVATPEAETFFDKLRKMFNGVPSVAYATAASIILVTLIGGYFLINSKTHSALQVQYAALNQKDLSDLAPYSENPKFSASDGDLRGGTAPKKIIATTDDVLARLSIPSELEERSSFTIKLIKDRAVLLELKKTRVYENANGKEFRLLLPGKAMQKGRYLVEAVADDLPDSKLNYYFEVE